MLQKFLNLTSVLLIGVGLLMAFQRPAFGYVDPGTGLLALQAVGSGIAAIGFFLRRKIFGIFSRKKTDAEPELHSVPGNSSTK